MCGKFYWRAYGDSLRLGFIDNIEQINIKPNWAVLKVSNHNPPIYISQYNKNFKEILGYSSHAIYKGLKVRI